MPKKRILILKELVRCSADNLDGVAAWYKAHKDGLAHSSIHIMREYKRAADCLPCGSRLEVYDE